MTLSPIAFFTGTLSPVIKASSICVAPSIISPSTAIFSPGLQMTISPFCISSNVTCFCFPSFSIVAKFGVIIIKSCMASLVLSLFLPSTYFPILIKKRIITMDS